MEARRTPSGLRAWQACVIAWGRSFIQWRERLLMIRSKDWGGKGRFSSSARRGRISRLVSGEGEEGEEEGGRRRPCSVTPQRTRRSIPPAPPSVCVGGGVYCDKEKR